MIDMRTTQLKNKIALTLLALACSFAAKGALATTELTSGKDYIRVTVPAESLDQARLVYGIEDQQVEATFKDGDVISLHSEYTFANQLFLGSLSFSSHMEEGRGIVEVTQAEPVQFAPDAVIHFSSTNESAAINS